MFVCRRVVVLDDVKELVQKIGPEFETVFDRNNAKPEKGVAQMDKADRLMNGAGGHAKAD